MGKVPLLATPSGDIIETVAITRFVDSLTDEPRLAPQSPLERATCDQIIAVADSYLYWPLVRVVAVQGHFLRRAGQPADEAAVSQAIEQARPALRAVDERVASQGILKSGALSLADIHLAPMLDYFALAEQGRATLSDFPNLANLLSTISATDAHKATRPDLG